jgi:hypothetical protein
MLSSGMLSSGMLPSGVLSSGVLSSGGCHLDVVIWCVVIWGVVIWDVVIWGVVIWGVVIWGFVLWGVFIWCCHLKLSSQVTRPPFYIFIENFIHSKKTLILRCLPPLLNKYLNTSIVNSFFLVIFSSWNFSAYKVGQSIQPCHIEISLIYCFLWP